MKKISIVALALAVFVSCMKEEAALRETRTPEEVRESAYVPGVMIVKFTEEMADAIEAAQGGLETKSASLNAVLKDFGVVRYTRAFDSDPRWVERERREGLHLWYRLEVDPALSLTKATADLVSVPGVIDVVPERRVKLCYTTTPNDTYFSREWHLKNSSGPDLNVQKIWTEYTQGDPKVIVNVVDGGIDPTHEDLQYNVIPGGSNGGSKNFVNNSYTITGHFHGTHVAGTIAATTNNGKGVAGIAGGDYAINKKGVRLLCSQVFTNNSSASNANFGNAIKYGADNGAVISQNSWGYNYDTNDDGVISSSELAVAASDYIDSYTKAGVDYFIKYAGCDNQGNQLPDSPMKGGIVFFAAGNDNIQYGWPANYDKILSVGALTQAGKKASFSNYGDWVDICAPGQTIYNTACGDYGTYSYMSGTSMACPMISGVAALILSYRGGPGFTNEFLWECLTQTAKNSIPSSKIGPIVDAYAAFTYKLESAPDPLSDFTVEALANNIKCTWLVQSKSNGTAIDGALVCVGSSESALRNLDPENPSSSVTVIDVPTATLTAGSFASAIIPDLAFNSTYYVTVIPYNKGEYSTVSVVKTVKTASNNPPTIVPQFDESVITLRAASSATFAFAIEDPDGHTVEVTVKKGSEEENWSAYKEGKLTVGINAPQYRDGTYTAKITAKDSYGLTANYDFTYTILPNTVPVVDEKLSNIVANIGDPSFRIPLSKAFKDADGDVLSYEAESSSTATVSGKIFGDELAVSFGSTSGTAKLTVTAKDACGASVTQIVNVLLRVKGVNVSVYPTQVEGKLNIETGVEKENVKVTIYSQTGAVVMEKEGTSRAFHPMVLDLSALTPGRYQVKVEVGGEVYVQQIVKL